MRTILLAAVVAFGFGTAADAADVKVTVAANFTAPAKEIAAAFKAKTGDDVVLSFGASGAAYTQISQGAPFEVWLSADSARPAKAVSDGTAVAGSEFTYAVGTLVLWSKDPNKVTGPDSLTAAKTISIGNPKSAPYGAAAIETLNHLGLYATIQPKIVQGSDITQAFQFVDSGNADVGFVALSQIIKKTEGSRWVVPSNLYNPILQDAVLLKKGEGNPAAKAFIAFLKGSESAAIIKKYGYGLGNES